MNWTDLYRLIEQITIGYRKGGRYCFAALVAAFLYHERFHRHNAVDSLSQMRKLSSRMAYRKIEKFLKRKTMRLECLWQWLWWNYTRYLNDCYVVIDWTMWGDGRQVLLAAIMHRSRCLPFLAVAYDIRKIERSQNQAESAFFIILRLLRRVGQRITCINDRGFARISLLKELSRSNLHFITRVCHQTHFENEKYQGLLKNLPLKMDQVRDLGLGMLGKEKKNQTLVRLIAYRAKGYKAPWYIASERLDPSAQQIVDLYTRRMGIEAGFRDIKGLRYGWGLKKIKTSSDLQLSVLWTAAMVAYALRMAAGAHVLERDKQAMFNWTRKGPRRSMLSVGRNAITSGYLKIEELLNQLPKLALRLSEVETKLERAA
jgi:hypothetical protein